ncbi:leucine-rich repeat protein 1-like [Drosophila willistoni]|uniref:leucine-rich repeat protein 1-like n=1 Tax=Drosophila willistoni TaxID=7260 RepID=UPI001F07C1A1|nr:leucine-rich repeat protein 1-like [Drosophila willistoni]
MEGKDVINLRLNTVTAMAQKSKLQTKMAINRHSDYPIKVFPRYLQSLTIDNTQLVKLSYHICSLRNLTHLDVSNNKLRKLPVELGRLHLSKLVLHDNNLGEMDDWSFLNGSKLRDSLRELDLSANDLTCLPLPVVKCHKLVNLNLNYNNLTHLPFAIRRLRRLRSLYVSENKLKSLPAAIDDLRIEILDVWRNSFKGLNVLEAHRLAFASDADGASTHSPEPLWLQAVA